MTKRTALTTTPRGQTVPDALCPACSAPLHYHTGRRLACSAADCPWAVVLTDAEQRDIAWYLTMPDMLDTTMEAFVAILAQRVTIVDVEPAATLIGTHPRAHTFKWRVISDESDPRKRLELKADQFEVNGGQLAKNGHCVLATSQEVDGEGRPLAEYHLCPQRDGTWTCDCPARVFCCHLAGYWRHLCKQAAEPGRGDYAQIATVIAALERQAGIVEAREPAAVAGKRTPAVQDAGTAAYADLYGS